MNQRKVKKDAKKAKVRFLESPIVPRVEKVLPINGMVKIGKVSATVRYVDEMGKIVSSESGNSPIVLIHKPSKPTIFISKVLRKTGIEPLVEIGDVITGKL